MPRLQAYRWDSWTQWATEQVEADQPYEIAVDTETTGLGFYDEPFCATLTWRAYPGGPLKSAYVSLEDEAAAERREALMNMLDRVPLWVFHNAKFDLQKLALIGALPPHWRAHHEIADTQVVQALLNENERKGLKHLARTVLGEETNEEAVLKKVRRKLGLKKADGYYHIPREFIVPYAIKDTEFTLRLYERLRPKLPEDVEAAYRREIELILVLLDMEANGIALDMAYLEKTTSEYGVRVMQGWDAIVTMTGRPDLNPQSPKQIMEAFADRGINLESTAVATLKKLDDELADKLLEYRSDKKMHTTYLTALLNEQRDGVVHPWFNPVQARTGRMSSSGASN